MNYEYGVFTKDTNYATINNAAAAAMAKVALFSTTASPLVKTAEEVGLAVVVVDEADAVALADDDDAEVDPAITRSAQTNFLPSLEVSWI